MSSWLSVGCAGGLLLAQLLWKLCGSLWKCGSHRSRDRDRSRGRSRSRGCGCCCEMAAAPGMDNATKALGANLAQSVGARWHPQDGAKAEPPPLLQHPGEPLSTQGSPSAPPGPQPRLHAESGRWVAPSGRGLRGPEAELRREAARGRPGNGAEGGARGCGGGGERCPGTLWCRQSGHRNT